MLLHMLVIFDYISPADIVQNDQKIQYLIISQQSNCVSVLS